MKESTKNLILAQRHFSDSVTIYSPDQIDEVITMTRPYYRFSWSNKKLKYFNVPISFDIETSSFYENGEKRATMYMWSLSIMGAVIIGRSWREFLHVLDRIAGILDLDINKRVIIYVHNLAYEFQFFRKYLNWFKVFAVDMRKPAYAVTESGIEFRCSYLLSNKSLESVAGDLRLVPVEKLTGTVDYDLIRHQETDLTREEIQYSKNDVLVVTSYILDKILSDGGIANIPLTNTGYVRRYCRDSCFYEQGESKKKSVKRMKYREIIGRLQLDPDEYIQLKRGFQGGFTHANSLYTGIKIEDVDSFDFSSSYPAVIIANKFPMSRSERVDPGSYEEFLDWLNMYCCLFDIEFTGLIQTFENESYISRSRCFLCENEIVNNGRIVSADRIRTTITEQDFFIIRKVYTWDEIKIANFRRYKRGYLPRDFIHAVLDLYQRKTILKGIDGSEVEYMRVKGMLNSCYGMMVTDIVRPEYLYTDDWEDPETPDLDEEIGKYNKNPGRFLFYPWGVWVTAYARRNLWTGILECNDDYIYSDTDSIKILDSESHAGYIEEYNRRITEDLERAAAAHDLDPSAIRPVNQDGEVKPLGIWEHDGHYDIFKTLGAKRYIYETNGKKGVTVAGLNKRISVDALDQHQEGFFDGFSDHLYIDREHTGKLTHTYIDEYITGSVTDYTGKPGTYQEESFIHLEKADYTLSLSQEYVQFITGIREEIE